jgi:hypothetical protein
MTPCCWWLNIPVSAHDNRSYLNFKLRLSNLKLIAMVGSWLFLFLSLLLLSSPLPTWPALPSTFGVPPALVSRYVPSSGDTFRCVDGSKSISWSAVNDDYCDCPDGSDEPGELNYLYSLVVVVINLRQTHTGTSACAQGTFYCANKGHIGAQISSTRVLDGLCGTFASSSQWGTFV